MADITSITPGSISADVTVTPGSGSYAVEAQISTRSDFAFAPAPIFVFGSPLSDLNQRCTYYLRVRDVLSGGVRSDWSTVMGFHTSDGTAQAGATAAIAIAPAIMAVPEVVLAWTGFNTVDGFPPENLAIDGPVAWRASGTPFYLVAHTAGAPIDVIALLRTNLPESARVTIKAGNSQANVRSGSPSYVFGPVDFRASPNLPGKDAYHGLFLLPDPVSFAFWRIEITAGVPGGALHIEHAVLGLNLKTRNMIPGKNEEGATLTTVNRSRVGQPDRQEGLVTRKVDFSMALLSEQQLEITLQGLHKQLNKPILIVPNSKSGAFLHDRILYGNLTSVSNVNPFTVRLSFSAAIESII